MDCRIISNDCFERGIIMPKEISAEQLMHIIDVSKDAVDGSTFGPLFIYPDDQDFTKKQINQVAFGVFTIVLAAALKDIS